MAYKANYKKSLITVQRELWTTAHDQLQSQLLGARDGLRMVGKAAIEQQGSLSDHFQLSTPGGLVTWLRDLCLLRHLPLPYLIPDPRLLPPESIRFFHVDRMWTDRLVDGVLWAGNLGTLDVTFRLRTLATVRDRVQRELNRLVYWNELNGVDEDADEDGVIDEGVAGYGWDAREDNAAITGLIIRSQLVARWPDLIVDGFDDLEGERRVRLLRRDLLSKNLLIALFAGVPRRVEVKEPPVGMRFGVEQPTGGASWVVNLRAVDGEQAPGDQTVAVPRRGPGEPRVLDVAGLRSSIDQSWPSWKPPPPGYEAGARDVGLHLEQLPYVQLFMTAGELGVAEAEGSKLPRRRFSEAATEALLRSGRTLRASVSLEDRPVLTSPFKSKPPSPDDGKVKPGANDPSPGERAAGRSSNPEAEVSQVEASILRGVRLREGVAGGRVQRRSSRVRPAGGGSRSKVVRVAPSRPARRREGEEQ